MVKRSIAWALAVGMLLGVSGCGSWVAELADDRCIVWAGDLREKKIKYWNPKVEASFISFCKKTVSAAILAGLTSIGVPAATSGSDSGKLDEPPDTELRNSVLERFEVSEGLSRE